VGRPHADAEGPGDEEKQTSAETEIEDSNPNAAGPQGLRGNMGVSSERTGPLDEPGARSTGSGIQGTGSRGTAAANTEGTMNTSGRDETDVRVPRAPADGPEMDDTQQEATQDWRDTQPEAGSHGGEDDSDDESVDRTVGESNTAEVPGHDFDPSRNPGHSHG